MLKPLPKRPYDLTPEELEESVRAHNREQLAPKRPPPREKLDPEKVERFVKNFRNPRPKSPPLANDYDRVLLKTISQEAEEKKAAYLLKKQKMKEDKEAADRLKKEQFYAAKRGKQVPQLGEQAKKSISPLKVISTKTVAQLVQPQQQYQYAWTYKPGKSLVRPEEISSLSYQLRRLHHWYEKAVAAGHEAFWVSYKKKHYFTDDLLYIPFPELFQLFNQDALNTAIVSSYCL